jgi:2,3,4,5-tetrahydropyridine-2-carboxylate N-succinyltransferase
VTDDPGGRTPDSLADLAGEITAAWNGRDEPGGLPPETAKRVIEAVDLLDRGEARVAEVIDGEVVVHQWLKQAILLCFRLRGLETIELGPFEYHDRIPLKHGYAEAKVRAVPGASARWGSYLAPGVTLMPSYVNIGAYVGEGSMVDTWATVGSCAQVGRGVHLSGGVGVGGVLEPLQASPVLVEHDAFIGSRCMLIEGARVGEGAVVGAGVILSPTIPVIDADSGEEISRGHIPSWSVAIGASRTRSFPGGDFGLPCVLVVKRLGAGERHDKVVLNELVRDHGAAL